VERTRPTEDDLSDLRDLAERWQATVKGLDPRSLTDSEAVAALNILTQAERVCAAARTVVARPAS
jgi:hypothetical protein